MTAPIALVRDYLVGLQRRIIDACAQVDGRPFVEDAWR